MISIIVPVYNAEKYLDRCIQSILAQTYTDFELLLINDGSTDSSGAICDKYAEQDSRVRVFHKENGGVSSARNMGLDNAVGEWITFVDSDDWVLPQYVENLLKCKSENNDVDLVISMSANVYSNRTIVPSPQKTVISSDKASLLFTEFQLSWRTSPWGKLYKKSLINLFNLKFDKEMTIGEDLVFLYKYISMSNVIVVSDKIDYYYNVGVVNSLTKRVYNIDTELICMRNVHDIVAELINEKGINNSLALMELDKLKASYINRVLNSLYNTAVTYTRRMEILKTINFSSYVAHVKKNATSFKDKLALHLVTHRHFRCYDMMRQINRLKFMFPSFK